MAGAAIFQPQCLQDWKERYDLIYEIYWVQDRTLEETREIMRAEHKFSATLKQWKDKIKLWRLNKNITTNEMRHMVRLRQKRRDGEGKDTRFFLHGREVSQEKIDRWIKRYYASSASVPLSPSTMLEMTPSSLAYTTPSEASPPPPRSSSQSPMLSRSPLCDGPATSQTALPGSSPKLRLTTAAPETALSDTSTTMRGPRALPVSDAMEQHQTHRTPQPVSSPRASLLDANFPTGTQDAHVSSKSSNAAKDAIAAGYNVFEDLSMDIDGEESRAAEDMPDDRESPIEESEVEPQCQLSRAHGADLVRATSHQANPCPPADAMDLDVASETAHGWNRAAMAGDPEPELSRRNVHSYSRPVISEHSTVDDSDGEEDDGCQSDAGDDTRILRQAEDWILATKDPVQNTLHPPHFDKSEALFAAARGGNSELIRDLLMSGADFRARTKTGMTAIHLAAVRGHVAALSVLLDFKADVRGRMRQHVLIADRGLGEGNVTILRRPTALHLAVSQGHLPAVQFLLAHGADIDGRDRGDETALMWAVRLGFDDIVDCLVERNAGLEGMNMDGKTALHIAARYGRGHAVGVLLAKGALASPLDNSGRSPLREAMVSGHSSCAEQLLQRLTGGYQTPAVDPAQYRSYAMDSPLHAACRNGDLGVTIVELEQGTNPNIRTWGSCTPLHLACQNGHGVLAELLLDQGADVNAVTVCRRTALHFACTHGPISLVRLLLDKGADLNASDFADRTALHLACKHGHIDIVELLLERGADPHQPAEHGRTALHLASLNGHLAAVELLVAEGVELDVGEYDHRSALQLACKAGHVDVVQLLLDRGANLEWKASLGRTVLDFAILSHQAGVIELIESSTTERGLES